MISDTILSNLVLNETYSRKVLAHLKPEYFTDQAEKTLFDLVYSYTTKYNSPPSKEALFIDLENKTGLSEENYSEIKTKINEMSIDSTTNLEWLVSQTENYCQQKALYNAAIETISIIDGKDKSKSAGTIPDLFSKALSVSFTSSIGHDYTEDYEQRYAYYHEDVSRIPFDLEYFNKVTQGGVPRKTLSVAVSNQTGAGKTLTMEHFASACLMQNLNVLYISMELRKEEISKRLDANLMNVKMDELKLMPKELFIKKAKGIGQKTKGRLVVEEYATGSAHVGHFRHLIHELKLKKKFIPDVIFVDYLNICASSRFKKGSTTSYEYVKAIAEEIRGLASETDTAIISATQGTKDGIGSTDIDMGMVSESSALAHTVDFLFAIIRTEELDELGQLMFKQLKNRFGPEDKHRRFVVGVDRSYMRLYDLNEDAQKSFRNEKSSDDTPVMDKSDFVKKDSGSKKKFEQWS